MWHLPARGAATHGEGEEEEEAIVCALDGGGRRRLCMREEEEAIDIMPLKASERDVYEFFSQVGKCRGCGFIQFAQLEHARAAQSLNGKLDIAGRIIKVSAVTDHVTVQETGTTTVEFDDEDGGGLFSKLAYWLGSRAVNSINANLLESWSQIMRNCVETTLNARSRAMLMQKLDRTGTASSIAESLGVPILNGAAPIQQSLSVPVNGVSINPAVQQVPAMVEPTECLMLTNMFDPSTETEPDFDFDIKEDVQEECSKYGHVKHIFVDKNSHGPVYLQFDSVAAASICQRAMQGRWFAGRSVTATCMNFHGYGISGYVLELPVVPSVNDAEFVFHYGQVHINLVNFGL
ncbi:hypothetical protein ZIOFF_067924 [Zingiber officinale]|uniref:RRM domain-containing protein n=1 Tax=Zingiber officinale TaxID=94328 RepID=A0A8J5EVJ2_ZINOF|nr:hypothetical protein ZIOFF_067924 [Zingiber officinale]